MIIIISDSSSDLFELEGLEFASAPLKVHTSSREYIDHGPEEVMEMVEELASTKEKSSTSCPNAAEWLEAFSKDDDNICFTISGNLSGSYNACLQAKNIYEEENDHKVVIIDSYTSGGEIRLLINKAAELIKEGLNIDELEAAINEYSLSTHTYFYSQSVNNLAKNGRIPPLVSKAISVLKISLVGMGSDEGKIKMIHETRGPKKAIDFIYSKMIERGYKGGKVAASTCDNKELEDYFVSKIRNDYPDAEIDLKPCGILCSYYVEHKGIIIGFEGNRED
ncbi:MAG: DegV family protein [Erysipelotrichaceae bacterium]|nr:DegV family protein [Erysipelotrichaceae bacterium]